MDTALSTQTAPLHRARITSKIVTLVGVVLLLMGLNAEWILNHFPVLLYLIIVLSFVELGLFGYILFNLTLHFREARLNVKSKPYMSTPIKILLVSIIISALIDSSYAFITDNWNQYAIGILIALMLGLLAIPFHIMKEEHS